MSESTSPKPCCPPFIPDPWEDKTLVWNKKQFIKSSVPTLLHMPLPLTIDWVMNKLWKAAKMADAAPELKDFLLLSHDPSAWKSDYYLAVTKRVAGIQNEQLSGTFLTKVFDGPYSSIPQWMKEMATYVEKQGKKVERYYLYYTVCPKCAKIYGHNYVVFFAKVAE